MSFKLKNRKSALKRVLMKKKNFFRKKAYKAHLLRKKNKKRLRHLSQPEKIHKVDKKAFSLMLSSL
jgi:ribosomal protein L35